AASGTEPGDRTSAALDVAGYTLYYGVLYGGRLSGVAIQSALMQAHRTYPRKPIMVMEYGHWADNRADESQQLRVFNTYYAQLSPAFDTEVGGFVGAALWWTLDDYWNQRTGLSVETIYLYLPEGSVSQSRRKAGVACARSGLINCPV